MDHLLFDLAHLECVHASWMLLFSQDDRVSRYVDHAAKLLELSNPSHWPARWRAGQRHADRIARA